MVNFEFTAYTKVTRTYHTPNLHEPYETVASDVC